MSASRVVGALLGLGMLVATGCKTETPSYARPLRIDGSWQLAANNATYLVTLQQTDSMLDRYTFRLTGTGSVQPAGGSASPLVVLYGAFDPYDGTVGFDLASPDSTYFVLGFTGRETPAQTQLRGGSDAVPSTVAIWTRVNRARSTRPQTPLVRRASLALLRNSARATAVCSASTGSSIPVRSEGACLMNRYRALQILVGIFGLACLAGLYPLIGALRDGAASTINRQDQMIIAIYVVLGIFLLIAARNPRDHRSLVLFAGWSTLAHDGVMIVQGIQHHDLRGDLVPFSVLAVLGVAIIVLSAAARPFHPLSRADAVPSR